MPTPEPSRVLSGWVQIAKHLGVTEPTARRYYRELGLPVDDRNGRYYAFADKLDEWSRQRAESPRRGGGRLPGWVGWIVAALAIVGASSALLLFSLPAPPSPHSVAVEGTVITALDREGREVWRRDATELMPEAERTGAALVADLDGDELNEVALTVLPPDSQAETSQLVALDDAGEILWTFTNGDKLTVRGRTFTPVYRGKTPSLLDLRPRPWLLNVAHHAIWYPTQVTLLDPATGEPGLEYWHPGRVHSPTLADLDSDGHPELYLGAINNPGLGVGHPSLAVLAIPEPGVEIATSTAFFRQDNPREIAYLLFPTYDVFAVQQLGAGVLTLEWQPDRRLLLGIGVRKSAMVYQYLNADLEIEEIRPSDGFLQEHRRLFDQGRLDHRYSPDELAAWRRVVRFDKLPDGNSREVEQLFESLRSISRSPSAERNEK